jgi:hypothetical protein
VPRVWRVGRLGLFGCRLLHPVGWPGKQLKLAVGIDPSTECHAVELQLSLQAHRGGGRSFRREEGGSPGKAVPGRRASRTLTMEASSECAFQIARDAIRMLGASDIGTCQAP